jgi:hypothetical protein
MLTSRVAELEKRDRLNAKGKDGGSFIPRAVVIKGITPDAGTLDMAVALPEYITINNILDVSLMINYPNDQWWISGGKLSDLSDRHISSFITTDNNVLNFIIGNDFDNNHAFRLTVFYKG